jgi:hypothetical protein
MLAFPLPGADDEAGGDVPQAQAPVLVVEGDSEHRLVGHGGAADHIAACRFPKSSARMS